MMAVVTIKAGHRQGYVQVAVPVDGFFADSFSGEAVVQFGAPLYEHVEVKEIWERYRGQITASELPEFKKRLLHAAGLEHSPDVLV